MFAPDGPFKNKNLRLSNSQMWIVAFPLVLFTLGTWTVNNALWLRSLSHSIHKDLRVKLEKKPGPPEWCPLNFLEIAIWIPRSEQMFWRNLCEKRHHFLKKTLSDRLEELAKRIRFLIKSCVSVGNQLTRSTPITMARMSQPSGKVNFRMRSHQWNSGSGSLTEKKKGPFSQWSVPTDKEDKWHF